MNMENDEEPRLDILSPIWRAHTDTCPQCHGATDHEPIPNPGGPGHIHVWCLWEPCGYEYIMQEAATKDRTMSV